MEDVLILIKNFIVTNLASVTNDSILLDKVNSFLQKLIDYEEGAIKKNDLHIKASRQLLCSIGIDIKYKAVPTEFYLQIFKLIDYSNTSKPARMLFTDSVIENKLFYRLAEKKIVDNFCIIVFPIKDWKFYINPKFIGIYGRAQAKYVHKKLINYISKSKLQLNVHSDFLDKKSDIAYFWFSSIDEVDSIIVKSENAVSEIVDRLGLSHFDFSLEEMKYYFAIRFDKGQFETFKPNATIVDWNNPKVGFLSSAIIDFGKTFNISGISKFPIGMRERVLHKYSLNEKEKEQSSIMPLKAYIDSINIDCHAIITEGINRFN
jgi:hypothetical protein